MFETPEGRYKRLIFEAWREPDDHNKICRLLDLIDDLVEDLMKSMYCRCGRRLPVNGCRCDD